MNMELKKTAKLATAKIYINSIIRSYAHSDRDQKNSGDQLAAPAISARGIFTTNAMRSSQHGGYGAS
jgi:hypothetical protein